MTQEFKADATAQQPSKVELEEDVARQCRTRGTGLGRHARRR